MNTRSELQSFLDDSRCRYQFAVISGDPGRNAWTRDAYANTAQAAMDEALRFKAFYLEHHRYNLAKRCQCLPAWPMTTILVKGA